MSSYKEMFNDAIRDAIDSYCVYHTDATLEYSEIAITNYDITTNQVIKKYYDVPYCPDCFKEHEKGKRFKHKIKTKPLFTNIKRSKHATTQ